MLHKRVYIERWDNRYFLIPIPQGEINKSMDSCKIQGGNKNKSN